MHSVHQVAVGGFEDIPPGAHVRKVEATGEQHVFLATGNTDFADEAYAALLRKCPKGRVVAVQARHSTSLSVLSYNNELVMTGYCLDEQASATSASAPPVVVEGS
jgi:hypothetical protein